MPTPHTLEIGTLLDSADPSPARLLAHKMNRHTFWCGQSGSGKTYALGVLLEQMLLNTRVPVVILDPNSDFVKLPQLRENVPPEEAGKLQQRDIRVLRPGEGEGALHVRLLDLSVRTRAAVLRIDPVLDAAMYNELLHVENEFRGFSQHLQDVERGQLVQYLRGSGVPARQELAVRMENTGVTGWDLWAWGARSVTDHLDEDPDATVIDLDGFNTPAESRAAALAVLEHLWEHRQERKPRLIVIDEAHNLCSPDPVDRVHALVTEYIVRIAAEGRKFGLWLLLSTQRPSKVHPNALSQCDNLAVMRMSSPRDLDELARVFGYVPEPMLSRAPTFLQGQALFAGGFIEQPSLVQMGDRYTQEGGTDVAVPLR